MSGKNVNDLKSGVKRSGRSNQFHGERDRLEATRPGYVSETHSPAPAGSGYAVQSTPSGATVARFPTSSVLPSAHDAVVEILCCTICEADRRFTGGSKVVDGRPAAVVLGHEAVGVVTRAGAEAGVSVGDVVAIMPHIVRCDHADHAACSAGDIFRLATSHAGMGVDGTMASGVVWPGPCLMPIRPCVVEEAKRLAPQFGLHWSAPLAEIEHLACVLTAHEHGRRTDALLGGGTFRDLHAGTLRRIVILGAGWMGYLNWLVLKKSFPDAEILIRDVDEQRVMLFRELAGESDHATPAVVHPEDASFDASADLVIVTTSARAANAEAFRWVKPNGHLMLFSGIHEGAVNPLFDPAGFTSLEPLHRHGGAARIHRTASRDVHDMVVASGSSGYSNRCFAEAAEVVTRFFPGIARGMTGVVLGVMGDRLQPLRPLAPAFATAGMPVMPALIATDWRGRNQHLKIAFHPTVSEEIAAAYARNEVRT